MLDPILNLGSQIEQLRRAVESGTPIIPVVNPGPSFTAKFPNYGDAAYRIMLDQDCTLSIEGGINQLQTLKFVIYQPPSGDCVLTIDSKVIWINKPPFIDSRVGKVNFFTIFYDGINYWGESLNG